MSNTLHLDLSESATRRSIFGQLVESTDEGARGSIGSVVADVSIRAEQHLHNLPEVEAAIDRTVATSSVKEKAKGVYRILAEAEAAVHGCDIEETHFHEVGHGMTVREILGICTAFEIIGAEQVTATPVQTGSGTVECAHGVLDIPAPATAAILQKYEIPVQSARLEGELCTPTSAAIIAYFVDKFE